MLELIDNVKEKITDNEYKLLVEKLGSLENDKDFRILVTLRSDKLVSSYCDHEHEFLLTNEPIVERVGVYKASLNCSCGTGSKCLSCVLKFCGQIKRISVSRAFYLGSDQLVKDLIDDEEPEVYYVDYVEHKDALLKHSNIAYVSETFLDISLLP
jgi:hypothetical protein